MHKDVCMTSSVHMCVNVLSGSCKDKHDKIYMYMHTYAFGTDMRADICVHVSIGMSSLNSGARRRVQTVLGTRRVQIKIGRLAIYSTIVAY